MGVFLASLNCKGLKSRFCNEESPTVINHGGSTNEQPSNKKKKLEKTQWLWRRQVTPPAASVGRKHDAAIIYFNLWDFYEKVFSNLYPCILLVDDDLTCFRKPARWNFDVIQFRFNSFLIIITTKCIQNLYSYFLFTFFTMYFIWIFY